MRKITFYSALLTLSALAIYSCSRDKTFTNDTTSSPALVYESKVRQEILKDLQQVEQAQGIDLGLQTRGAGSFIVVPANSNNALGKAIIDAGAGGVVYLRAGLHTESARITVTTQVVIIGETGAILKCTNKLGLLDANGVNTLNPAIYVLNAPRTAILNLEIDPVDGDGDTGILFENSAQSASMFNTFHQFQFSIFVEKSDQLTIIGNKIFSSTLWLTNPNAGGSGITNMNGKSVWIAENEVGSNVFGIFASDLYGSCVHNYVHDNFIGIIFCKVTENSIRLPGGQLNGAIHSAFNYKALNNRSDNNQTDGYMVVDGANNNTLTGNTSTGNGTYDIELVGVTTRFGYQTPTCFSNKVTAFPSQKVKNCGVDNVVVGGVLVNNGVDPCN